MRKNKIAPSLIVICFFALAACQSCKKDPVIDKNDPQPVLETDKMWATINGVEWESCTKGIYLSTESQVISNYFDVQGLYYCNDDFSKNFDIYVQVYNFNGIGQYNLNGNNKATYRQYDINLNSTFYRTDVTHIGIVSVSKFDTSKRKISGSFSFDVYNIDSDSVIHVTNGQFNEVSF